MSGAVAALAWFAEETYKKFGRDDDFGMEIHAQGMTKEMAIGGRSQAEQDAWASQQADAWYALAAWFDDGVNTFSLSESMTSALLLTDPPEFKIEEFPFGAFAVQVPRGYMRLEVDIEDLPSKHDATVAVIARRRVLELDAIVMCAFDLSPSSGITSMFPTRLRASDFGKIVTGEIVEPARAGEINCAAIPAWRRLMAGLISWVAASGGVSSQRSSVKRNGKNSNKVRPNWIEVGKSVRLSREMIEAGKDCAVGHGGARWKVSSRYVVRGHYRNQACGAGHAERKTIWIQPHWKGPEGEKAWAHIYEPVSH